jgi:hypothetical protein
MKRIALLLLGLAMTAFVALSRGEVSKQSLDSLSTPDKVESSVTLAPGNT